LKRLEVRVHAALEVLEVHALRPPHAPLLIERAPGEAQPRLVEERAQPVGVGHPEEDGRRVRHVAEARLGLAHVLLGVALGGDVADDPQRAHHLGALAQGPVPRLEAPAPPGGAHDVAAVVGSAVLTVQRARQQLVLAALAQERKQLEQVLPEHVGCLVPPHLLERWIEEQHAQRPVRRPACPRRCRR
jgi:hypothetical protein